jgi:hypothetical protein
MTARHAGTRERCRPGGELSQKKVTGNTPAGRQRSQVCASADPVNKAKHQT